MPGIIIVLKYPKLLFLFNRDGENVSQYSVLRNCLRKYMQMSQTMLNFREVPPTLSLCLGKNDGRFISTWNSGTNILGASACLFLGCLERKSS
jgi:hypothetical protein